MGDWVYTVGLTVDGTCVGIGDGLIVGVAKGKADGTELGLLVGLDEVFHPINDKAVASDPKSNGRNFTSSKR